MHFPADTAYTERALKRCWTWPSAPLAGLVGQPPAAAAAVLTVLVELALPTVRLGEVEPANHQGIDDARVQHYRQLRQHRCCSGGLCGRGPNDQKQAQGDEEDDEDDATVLVQNCGKLSRQLKKALARRIKAHVDKGDGTPVPADVFSVPLVRHMTKGLCSCAQYFHSKFGRSDGNGQLAELVGLFRACRLLNPMYVKDVDDDEDIQTLLRDALYRNDKKVFPWMPDTMVDDLVVRTCSYSQH